MAGRVFAGLTKRAPGVYGIGNFVIRQKHGRMWHVEHITGKYLGEFGSLALASNWCKEHPRVTKIVDGEFC